MRGMALLVLLIGLEGRPRGSELMSGRTVSYARKGSSEIEFYQTMVTQDRKRTASIGSSRWAQYGITDHLDAAYQVYDQKENDKMTTG
jgi:hypothetical protein